MRVEIPKNLLPSRDKAVKFAYGNLKKIPDLHLLEDWFENGDGWDDLVMSNLGYGIYLESFAERFFSSAVLSEYIDIEPEEIIEKSQKLAFARERLEHAINHSEDSLHAVQFNLNPEAYLVCIIMSQGQGGWEVSWRGVFKSLDELTKTDLGLDDFFIDQESMSDEKILSLWVG